MKQKINMIGGGFQHDVCSSALNKNKYVEWVKGYPSSEISIHIDQAVLQPVDKTKINYGWLCESSAIIPNVIETVTNNIDSFKQRYKYIFTQDVRVVDKDPDFFKFTIPCAVPWIQNKKIYEKSKLVSMIASNKRLCSGHLYRQEIISKLQDKLDHYGRGFSGKELPWMVEAESGPESGKILALKDYMFSVAMENANYDYAFCEKVTDCFATGTIPIFWGGNKIVEFFDKDGIIFLEDFDDVDSLTPELYFSKIESVKRNLELLKELNTSEDYFYLKYIKEDL